MAKGVTSKSRNKDEENKRREEQQKPHSEQKQTTQKQKPGQSKPQNETPVESKPATQEVAPKPTSTQIPTLEPKYASPEQIEEARDFGRRSLEMARAGQLDMSEKIPFTQGVEGYAELYRIPELEDYEAGNNNFPQTRQEATQGPSYNASERDYMMQQNASRNEQRRAERQPVDILGSRLEAGQDNGLDKYSQKFRPESTFDASMLSEKDARRLERINNEIAQISERMSRNMGKWEDQRALSALQAEKAKITQQNLVSDEGNSDETLSTWLDPNYKMGESEIEQAKQIIQDYENNEYKNSNIYDLTDEEAEKLSKINALRDKVSKAESAVYGAENATINPLMVAADRDFYGWTVDDLRDEVARQRDLPMSPEVRAYVNQLQQEIADLQSQMDDANTVYSTGDAGVDEVIGSNTQYKNTAELQQDIEDKQAQMYKLMLEESRGNNKPNYDSYSLRKANAQKQNPVPYLAGDMGTRMLESMAIQGAVGDNGFAADMLVDALTDTAPEYLANRAGGMSRREAGNQALISAALNTAMDTGAWAASNPDEIASMFARSARENADNVIPTVARTQDEVIENAARQADEIPTMDPAELAKQNEIDVNAKVDNVNQAVDEINNLAEQVPNIPEGSIDYETARLLRRREAALKGADYSDDFDARRSYEREADRLTQELKQKAPELFDENGRLKNIPDEQIRRAEDTIPQEIKDYVQKREDLLNRAQAIFGDMTPEEKIQAIRSVNAMDEYMYQKYPDLFDNGKFVGLDEAYHRLSKQASETPAQPIEQAVRNTPDVENSASNIIPATTRENYVPHSRQGEAPAFDMPEYRADYSKGIAENVKSLEMPNDVRGYVNSKVKTLDDIFDRIDNAQTKAELDGLYKELNDTVKDLDDTLKDSAQARLIPKRAFDDNTKSFVNAIKGMTINVPDNVRAELPNQTLKQLEARLHFYGDGQNINVHLRKNSGIGIDSVFEDIDTATGHALSSFMEQNGLNPDVTENQLKGILEYADYLKETQNSTKVMDYTGGIFDDYVLEAKRRLNARLQTLTDASKASKNVSAPTAEAVPATPQTTEPAIPKVTEPEMAEVVDEIPTVNAAQAESDIIAKYGFNPNDPYVQDPNAIRKNQIPTQPGSRNSKLGTNTMRTLDSAEQNAEDLSRGLYSYVPKEEQETMRIGAQRVIESPNKAYNDILNTADDAFTAEDVDTSMMLRNKIKQDLALAKDSGDIQTANYLQSQLDALTIRQRKAATNAGQVSQAWAKWSRDADGATFAAYNIAARQYEDALKNNPRLGEMMHESAEELWERLANADLDKESVESLSDKIQDMLRTIIDKNGNYKIKRNFQEANIKKLSDTLAMQMKQNEDIGETLDMIEQAGVTGFTGLDDSIEQEVRDLFDQAEMFGYKSKQRFELENQAYAKLAEALNLTGGVYDKIDAVRYFAMLANPKTHFRNIAGNYTWGEITNFKDQLAGLLEEAVDRASLKKGARAAEAGRELKRGGQGIERTTTFIRKNGADRNLYNAALDDFEENAYTDLVGNKYTTAAQGIEGNKNVFGYGKVGSAASDTVNANAKVLELEDVAAKRRKYADSLTRYLKANGYDEAILKGDITDRKTLEFLEEARTHAIGEAEKATFNQQNWLSDKLSKFSKEAREINWSEEGAGRRAHKLAGLFLDATVPFKRTPMNIVTSLWDYQPIHLARFGVDIADIARHKPKAVNKLIDDLAKETTGVSLLAAGWGLAKSGFITGRKDEETGDLDELTGKQDYSLDLGPLGSYTLDWLSPSLTILLAGANLAQSGLTADGFTQMLADIGEPVLETTMLSSLVDVLRSAQYAKDEMETIQQSLATGAKNYITQFVPTELGNIARSVDNTRRSTYTDKTGVAGIADRAVKGIMNKIPGLSEMSQPYINRWGDQEQNYEGPGKGNVAARLAYNHLSPGYYSSDNATVKDDYLYNLYEQLPQKDQEIFPQAFSTKITEDGIQRKVTPEEKTMKDTVEGNTRDALITAMANSPEIQDLDPEIQAAIVKDMYAVAKLAGNASIVDGFTSTDKGYNTYLAGQQSKAGRTGAEDLLRYEIQKYTMKDAGISTTSNVSAALGEMYETDPERAKQLTDNVATLVNAGVSTAGQNTYVTRGINYLGNIDPEQYGQTWNAINSETGDTNKITQTELKDYFTSNKITNQEKMFELWGGYLTDFDPNADTLTVPYLKDDGTIGSHQATQQERELLNSILKGDSEEAEPATQQTTAQQTSTRPEPIYLSPDPQEAVQQIEASGVPVNYLDSAWAKASAANPNLTAQDFTNTWSAIDSDGNGTHSTSEFINYLNRMGYNQKAAEPILEAYWHNNWHDPRYINGKWSY